MAEYITVARPYAKATFQLAADQQQLNAWHDALTYAAQITADADMQKVLGHPSLSVTSLTDMLLELCQSQLAAEIQPAFKALIELLAENKRLVVLPQVAELFDLMKAEQEKSVDVELTSAFELSSAQEQKLATVLKASLNREVNLNSQTSPEILGGVIIRAGDTVIDGSVRGKLQKLAESIIS